VFFLHIFINTFEASFPIQNKIVGRLKNDWIMQGIKISRKHKGSLYICSKSSNNPHMWAFYIKYCTILSRVIEEAKRQHYCRLIAKSDNQIKITWNIIKQENYIWLNRCHLFLYMMKKQITQKQLLMTSILFSDNFWKSKLASGSERWCHYIFKRGISSKIPWY
jgi:hypothetical protein